LWPRTLKSIPAALRHGRQSACFGGSRVQF
jgi:hypothetical protein